jgi:hypothetical protein
VLFPPWKDKNAAMRVFVESKKNIYTVTGVTTVSDVKDVIFDIEEDKSLLPAFHWKERSLKDNDRSLESYGIKTDDT